MKGMLPGKFGNMKILIHPDLFYNEQSGAVAARTAAKILYKTGYQVGVFTHDAKHELDFECESYKRIRYSSKAHFNPKKWNDTFVEAIEDFKPDYIFFIGGIINTPTVYLSEARSRNIKTVFLLLVQDFYCTRMHAALVDSSCSKCLTGSNFNSLKHNCLEKGSNKYLYFLSYQIKQMMFLPELKKLTWVLGSTDEQIDFYKRIGIDSNRCFKIPLFFDPQRIHNESYDNQDYFVFIAQNRPEKGIHLLPQILNHTKDDIRIKTLFYSEDEANRFQSNFPQVRKYIESGQLEILPEVTMQNGAVEIISKCRAVLNLSIWATTTEFVFLEILGLKKTMVAFDVGIHKETIIHRKNGCLVKSGDFGSFANELDYLKNNPEESNIIGKHGYELFKELTSPEMFKNKLKTIFI